MVLGILQLWDLYCGFRIQGFETIRRDSVQKTKSKSSRVNQQDILNKTMDEWLEFRRVNLLKQGSSFLKTSSPTTDTEDESPGLDFSIINIVGAVSKERNRAGIGLACSDLSGNLLYSWAKSFEQVDDISLLEGTTIRSDQG
ncbi:hypothetical protein ACH5RR_014773 [Cinchona calisaya]|uniref:Uncharacterized protein n=1 Tax=Cinchona calisaya TaxID=153742 RepID=A0ABD2ZR85_9GENT